MAFATRFARGLGSIARCALPQSCVLCAAASGGSLLCVPCDESMPGVGDACPRCALPTPDAVECPLCRREPPPYDTAVAAWLYAWPADRLVQAFKYGGRLSLAEPFALALARACRARRSATAPPMPWPDCLVAIPLTAARQRERGFNQAQEIARRLGAELALPVTAGLERKRDAAPQATQGLRDRRGSVRGAFVADCRLAGASIAVVDDVMTTGATLAAAAVALRIAGARRIEAWAVLRTPTP